MEIQPNCAASDVPACFMMSQHTLGNFQHKFTFQRCFKYSNITHDRYMLVLPWETSTAITRQVHAGTTLGDVYSNYMTVTHWYHLGRCLQKLHMTGTHWYYLGKSLQKLHDRYMLVLTWETSTAIT